MKTGILWDLDGTLLDTLEDLADAVNYALEQFGYPSRTLEEVRRFVGNGARRLIALAVPEGADVDAVLETFRSYYDAHCQVKTGAYGGIMEVLEALGEKYPMAVVSNKPDSAVKALCARYFPTLYARGESTDCPRKPAPDMVFKAMEEIGVERCIYVGDSEVDVLTAKNAGVPCLSVLWGFRDREEIEAAGGKHFCEATAGLIEKLEELCNGK
ncbi:MAG: HAD-IA family hydrolase [Oscillospiraceae bacterium]|nr:HAD-IA family hydrolase [Oscillospiraceae bacterium]